MSRCFAPSVTGFEPRSFDLRCPLLTALDRWTGATTGQREGLECSAGRPRGVCHACSDSPSPSRARTRRPTGSLQGRRRKTGQRARCGCIGTTRCVASHCSTSTTVDVEADERADLVEGNPALVHQSADESFGDAEPSCKPDDIEHPLAIRRPTISFPCHVHHRESTLAVGDHLLFAR